MNLPNVKNRRRFLWALVFALAAAGGCSSRQSGSPPSVATMRAKLGIDLSSIKGFVIAPPGAVSSSAGPLRASGLRADQQAGSGPTTSEVLYSISASGALSIVQVTTEGSSVTDVQPLAIYDTVRFTLLEYSGVTYQGMSCTLIAARKSDSALFCIDAAPNTSPSGAYTPSSYSPVGSDATGNLVYVYTLGNGSAFPGGLVRLNFSDAATASAVQITDDTTDGGIYDMALNRDGDVLADMDKSGVVVALRLYRAGGGFMNVSASEGDCLTSGPGTDGVNFYYELRSTTSVHFVLHKLAKGATGFTDTIYYDDSSGSVGLKDCRYGSLVKTPAAVAMSFGPPGGAPGPSDYFIELVPGSNPVAVSVSLLNEVDKLYAYEGGLVIEGKDALGNGGLARYATATASFSTVLTPGDYSLTAVSVSPAGEITFGGRRASDNARVLGTVPAGSSTVTLQSSSLSGDVRQILRIN